MWNLRNYSRKLENNPKNRGETTYIQTLKASLDKSTLEDIRYAFFFP